MTYKGHILYDVYSILGTYKLNVDYDVEGFGNDFEITRISISLHNTEENISFNLEDEMEEILEECIKDFTIQKELMDLGKFVSLEASLVDIPKPKLANDKYDFSAN